MLELSRRYLKALNNEGKLPLPVDSDRAEYTCWDITPEMDAEMRDRPHRTRPELYDSATMKTGIGEKCEIMFSNSAKP